MRAALRTEASVTSGASSSARAGCSRSSSRRLARLGDQRLAGLGVDQLVHLREPLERVLAVEHAGLVDVVGLGAVRVEDPQAEVAVDRGAADQHRELQARASGAPGRAAGICFEVETSSARQPDRGRVVLDGRIEDRRDRNLLAEVDDRVAVVGEDRVDERLADVVDVAEHGREHDRALRVALELVEVLLQLGDRALHHLGRLEHEREDQLAGAELVADLLHRRQEHVVERRDGADLLDAAVDPVLDAVPLAAQDVEVQGLLGLHPLGRIGLCAARPRRALGLEVRDQPLQRVLAPVEARGRRRARARLGDLAVRRDVVGVDHRQIEPRLHAVVQEDAVDHAARRERRRRRTRC